MKFKDAYNAKREFVEQALTTHMMSDEGLLKNHMEAMRYSVLAGGKRVRPVLCIAAIEALAVDAKPFLPVACALECIHTYSLIHDDLPAMDNDDLRRGKPTNHTIYGEAEAILAGDGLLTYAFELLTHPGIGTEISSENQLLLIRIIAQAAGSTGMVGGQSIDIASEGKEITMETLRFIHSHKTGALITAAVQSGALCGNANPDQLTALSAYGREIGLAFQIVDDLLNVEGTTEQLGKRAGTDADLEKATYPAFYGVEQSRKMARDVVSSAKTSLSIFGTEADFLRQLADYIITRNK